MRLFACFCCNFKAKQHVKKAGTCSEPAQTGNVETTPDRDDEDTASKLEIIRSQLTEAQQHQKAKPRVPVVDAVIGAMDIPVYEAAGQALKSNGRTVKMMVYDK